MNDDNIDRFFKEKKQSLAGDGFQSRLFATLDCLPITLPQKRVKFYKRESFIVLLFGSVGFLLFVIAGGYREMMESLISTGGSGIIGVKSLNTYNSATSS